MVVSYSIANNKGMKQILKEFILERRNNFSYFFVSVEEIEIIVDKKNPFNYTYRKIICSQPMCIFLDNRLIRSSNIYIRSFQALRSKR